MTHMDRRALMQTALLAAALGAPAAFPTALEAQDTAVAGPTGALGDFDFLVGEWNVSHRRLKARLAGSTEWIEFDGKSRLEKIMGGVGTFDDNVINLPGGPYRAATLRAFNPKTRQWAVWWLDERFPDSIGTPMFGGFENGKGVFLGDDTFNGRPIKVRFFWTHETNDRCHWEQAFSADGGKTWETNWTMEFARTA